METPFNERDHELWRVAKKRVGFRRHLASYLIVNALFWAIWYFTGREEDDGFAWPVWPMLGWGIGLAFSFVDAFVVPRGHAIEKEFEKLKSR